MPATPGSWSVSLARHLVLLTLVLAACSEGTTGPDRSAPTTVTVISPAGAEGGAVLEVIGHGVATSLDPGEVVSEVLGERTRILVLRREPGALRFRFAPTDGSQLGVITILEVAGPDNALRTNPNAYSTRVSQ